MQPTLDLRELRFDEWRTGKKLYIRITHLPTGKSASAKGDKRVKVKREAVQRLRQILS